MTQLASIGAGGTGQPPAISPGDQGRDPTMGERSAQEEARRIVNTHRRRLSLRRYRDATAEKYVLHVDGEGGAQWHDLYHGVRMLMVPKLRGAPRLQNNQLRPILDNLVAHLSTQPIRYIVEARKDKDSRERAHMDQLLINYHVRKQKWNALVAEAKYIAGCYGFCPIHQMVRDDAPQDTFEGVRSSQGMMGPQLFDEAAMEAFKPPPIMLDAWVGNPWDMTFDSGAKRWSIHRTTYGRIMPTELVKAAFGIDDLEGDSRLPSASQFQLIAQRWLHAGSSAHGSAALRYGEDGDEELTGLVCEEIPPGILSDPRWKESGRLTIVALQGAATTQREYSPSSAIGRGKLLWQGELPGRTFSWVPFYSHWRMDDPLGKPFIADLDDDQIALNQLESLGDEYLRRASRPPLASTGHVNLEELDYYGDTVLQVEPGTPENRATLNYLVYPGEHLTFLDRRIARVLEGMYRKGAYQAASRGEGQAGESGKALIALQSADDSILGPLAMITQTELEEFAALSWMLLKEYLDVGMVVDIVGEEFAHMAEPYVDRTMLSKSIPSFRLVSGFGTSTESRAQQLLNLVQTSDPTGQPVLTADQLRQKWPDQNLFSEQDSPHEYRLRHARVVNHTIEKVADMIRENAPHLPEVMNHPQIMQMAQFGWQQVDMTHPLLMDDDINAHLDTLSLITQDDTQDPIARHIAMFRQDQYFQWLAMQQAQAQAAMADPMAAGDSMEPPRAQGPGMQLPATQKERGSPGAESMVREDKNFEQHARQIRSA